MERKRKKKIIIIEIIVFLIICCFVNSKYINLIPKCWVYENTGLYCFACGGTRCVQNMIKGNLIKAFYENSMIFIMIIYLAILNIIYLYNMGKEEKKLTYLYPKWWQVIIFVIIWIIYTIIKNIVLL
mgnify:FL=1